LFSPVILNLKKPALIGMEEFCLKKVNLFS